MGGKFATSKMERKMDKKDFKTMPPIGNYASRAEWEVACWRKLLESKKLLQSIITSHERHDLVMRAAALYGLASGKSYKQIGEELWLSPQTISGIKKAAREGGYRSYLERSKKERKKKIYYSGSVPPAPKRRGRPVRTKYGTVYIPD